MTTGADAVSEIASGEMTLKGAANEPSIDIQIGLLTGCQDRHYAFGLAMALASQGVGVDVIGSDEVDSPEFHATPRLRFLNFRGSQHSGAPFATKLTGLLIYYARLIRYVAAPQPKILHILWNNKFELFDRTLLMLYYRVCGKKIIFTAHNVNQAKRDSRDSLLNRLTLKMQYRLMDHIFTHTEKMKSEMCQDFGVARGRITVIPYPVNNAFPDTSLTPAQAKERLGIGDNEKTILFFGRISAYKGIEQLLSAFQVLRSRSAGYRLIIAGAPKKGSENLMQQIRRSMSHEFRSGEIILKAQFVPDDEIELYLKAADVLVLPYKDIFQSGVLFLAYAFGLPVVATDVGSFREEIIEGKRGFLCRPEDPADLAIALETYFASDLYHNLNARRREIKDYVNIEHSWTTVAAMTRNVYAAVGTQIS